MTQAEEQVVAQKVIETLNGGFSRRERTLVVVRCANNQVVDAARETLRRTGAPFAWKSMPIAELSPPDLAAFLEARARIEGPVLLGYSLPIGPQGGVLPEFLSTLQASVERYRRTQSLVVLLLTMAEMQSLVRSCPDFWTHRNMLVAWPASASTNRFVPARVTGSMAAQAFGSMAAQATGAVASQATGDVAATADGGIAAQAASGVATQRVGNVDVIASHIALAPSTGPWSGAPLNDEGEVPEYILSSNPPAGRRWGINLLPDDPEGAELIDEGRRLLDAVQVELARQTLSSAARHCRDSGIEVAQAECYVLLGKAAEIRIDFTVAFDWYKLAMDIYDRHADNAGYSDCCGFIAYMHFMQGDISGSRRCLEWGLKRDEAISDSLRMAASYRRLGVIGELEGDPAEAERLYKKAGSIEKEMDDKYSYSRSLNHLARVCRMQERKDDAHAFLKESIEIKEELEDEPGLASGYHELGNLLLNNKEFDEALGYYQDAYEIELRLRDIPGIAATQAQIGLVYRHLLSFPESLEALMVAKSLFRKLDSPNAIAVGKAIEAIEPMVDARAVRDAEIHVEEVVTKLLYAYEQD